MGSRAAVGSSRMLIGASLYKSLAERATVIIFIPNVITRLLHMISFEHLENEAAPVRRKMDYYGDCVIGKEYYKET